jgi:hypothetical protein
MSNILFKVNNEEVSIEEARIFGVFENYGVMIWYVELAGEDEKYHVLLNSLDFGESAAMPAALNGQKLDLPDEEDELFEHAFTIDGFDRYPETLTVEIKKWNPEESYFEISISGRIEEDEDEQLEAVDYSFEGRVEFTGLNLVETNQELVEEFVEQYMKKDIEEIDHSFEEIATGWMCKIKGPF